MANFVSHPEVKRILDIALSIIILIITTPAIIISALLVYISLGRPLLFRQTRAGLSGIPFTIYKFRTMREHNKEREIHVTDAERLTNIGKLLRSTSLDELPELINVLKGDMSLVGPRPLHIRYLPRYNDRQARRHEVRPGITGWAQVNGRNILSWAERLELDVWYVDNHTLALDMKILIKTIATVLRQEGVSAKNHVTMHEFTGDEISSITSQNTTKTTTPAPDNHANNEDC
ncbi:MAG: sugar transferase [Candidatus Sedimenticola endophacoides]